MTWLYYWLPFKSTILNNWIPDLSGFKMVDLCLISNGPVFPMVVWKLYWKRLLMVQNVRYLNGPPSHVASPFEYRTQILSSIQMNMVFRWLLYSLNTNRNRCRLFQVVRARLQDCHSQYSGAFDCVRKTMRYEGARGLYKGMTPYLFHVLPNICMVFLIYEKLTEK